MQHFLQGCMENRLDFHTIFKGWKLSMWILLMDFCRIAPQNLRLLC